MNTDFNINWKAKHPELLPDFIFGGAMKSGTTTLHAILNKHPDIAIAHNELGFFDIDSIMQHPDFNFFDTTDERWISQSFIENPEKFWNWYHSQFEGLQKEGKIVGEDSTTYLISRKAAQRIALQDKPIKMIFVLRQPTKRAISNYLHLLKSGRATYNLEDTLKYDPNSILRRSLYCEQLVSYYEYFPFESIKIVLFEDLISDTKACIKDICHFLGVEFNRFDPSYLDVHSNKTVVPKNLSWQLWRNRQMQKSQAYRYSNFLPNQPEFQKKLPLKYRLLDKIHNRVNPKSDDFKFVAKPATVRFLDAFFKVEMEGLDELTKKTILSKWFND